jgi:hypothetical protein
MINRPDAALIAVRMRSFSAGKFESSRARLTCDCAANVTPQESEASTHKLMAPAEAHLQAKHPDWSTCGLTALTFACQHWPRSCTRIARVCLDVG